MVAKKKPAAKKVAAKKVPTKKPSKETFEVGSFTERGAKSLRRIYEKAGYKFISHRMDDKGLIMQKFQSLD